MPNQKLWTKDYFCVLLTTFFAAITHNIFLSIFPLYVNSIGGNNALSGAMITGHVAAGTVTRLVCGKLQDRYGRKRVLVAGAFLFLLNTAAYLFVTDMAALFALRVFNGVSQGVYFGAASTIVADIAPPDRLVDGIGYFSIAAAVATAVSPMLGLWVFQNFGSLPLFLIASVSAAVGAAFPLFIRTQGHSEAAPRQAVLKPEKKGMGPVASVIELSVLAPALVSFFITLGSSSISNFLASCGVERGIENVSLYFLLNSITMISTRLFTGKLVKRFGEIKLIFAGAGLFLAALVLVAFAHTTVPVAVSGILAGFGLGVATPLINSLVFRFAPEEKRGVANSTFGLFGDLGSGLGGAVWGGVTQYAGYTAAYLLSAVSVLAGGALHGVFLAPKLMKIDGSSGRGKTAAE